MRNLKRTLSLVLAAVMLVGMMVVGASAASCDFNDSAEITNTEAVDVMTAIGVFEGTDKGAFNPTGILTREQAAKIVAVMLLGEEDANKLSTNSTTFKDVAAGPRATSATACSRVSWRAPATATSTPRAS